MDPRLYDIRNLSVFALTHPRSFDVVAFALNELLTTSAPAARSTRTVPVTIVDAPTEHDIDRGVIRATGMPLAVLPMVFTSMPSRRIITGMIAGAGHGWIGALHCTRAGCPSTRRIRRLRGAPHRRPRPLPFTVP